MHSQITRATAVAHPNIAFIKYWGNSNDSLRIPANGSLSMNLAELETKTTVIFDPSLTVDQFTFNHKPAEPQQHQRVSEFLDIVRQIADNPAHANVVSENNFPAGSGIASSASAFAALALAASSALGLSLSEKDLSRLARRGSGSASRSIPSGFVEWYPGHSDDTSYGVSIAQAEHWDLVDMIVLVDTQHKKVGSTEGHSAALTSPLQAARVTDASRRLDICRKAVLDRDFPSLANIIEQDCLLMHAVMMTSTPSLFYWQPSTLFLMEKVSQWRSNGLPVSFTIDAGPNLHLITTSDYVDQIRSELHSLPQVLDLYVTHAGGPAVLLES
jgi:diphosphomevalonate decarboxylase